jgi:hypothetical protein
VRREEPYSSVHADVQAAPLWKLRSGNRCRVSLSDVSAERERHRPVYVRALRNFVRDVAHEGERY